MHIKIHGQDDEISQHVFIRAATMEDAEQLHQLDESLAEETNIHVPMDSIGSVSDYMRLLVRALSNSRTSLFLVAESDGRVIGSLKCTGHRQRAFRHVANLDIAIHRDYRGQGVGSGLMEEACKWAKESGSIKRVELFVYCSNEVAIKLYKKFGFEIEGMRKKGLCHRGAYVDYYMMSLLFF